MKEHKRYVITFATLVIILILGILGYLGVKNFTLWKSSESKKLLTQSQNTPNIQDKFLYAQKAILLEKNDNTHFYLARAADLTGNYELANRELLSVSDSKIYFKWLENENNIWHIYQTLNVNYPQAARKFIRSNVVEASLTRDQLLYLSEDYYQTEEFSKSYDYANKARLLDEYYPQTYQQLIKVADKLNFQTDKDKYTETLRLITW